MTFAAWVFRIAGIYGILILMPMYFAEKQIGGDFPPAITHPEHYYGFLGVTLVWQILFLLISTDPVRYRPVMLVAILEKLSYAVAIVWLFAEQRVPALLLGFGLVDALLAVLFFLSYRKSTVEKTP